MVGVATRGKETAMEIIGTYAVAFDSGAEAYYMCDGHLDEESRKLAEYYKITLLARTH